ncbi:MAG: sulfur carrier protein ThiS [Thermodesulfobacteriota bacterium]|jgi:thiamine biosynthesis protein ThiS
MNVRLNGQQHLVDDGATLSDLVSLLKLDRDWIAVEFNQDVIPRARWGEVSLKEGDKIEVVQLVGGG